MLLSISNEEKFRRTERKYVSLQMKSINQQKSSSNQAQDQILIQEAYIDLGSYSCFMSRINNEIYTST